MKTSHSNTITGSPGVLTLKWRLLAAPVMVVLLAIITTLSAKADNITYSETLKEKLTCFREDGETFCDVESHGRYRVAGSVNWEGLIDPSMISADAEVVISMGGLEFIATLEDADQYTPGRSATFIAGHFNDRDRFIQDGKIVVKWNRKRFTFVATGKLGGNTDLSPILADDYVGEAPGSVSGVSSLTIEFAGVSLTVPIEITGKVGEKMVQKGGEEFSLKSVALKGRPTRDL